MSQVAGLCVSGSALLQKAVIKKQEWCCMFLKEIYVPPGLKYWYFGGQGG